MKYHADRLFLLIDIAGVSMDAANTATKPNKKGKNGHKVPTGKQRSTLGLWLDAGVSGGLDNNCLFTGQYSWVKRAARLV